MISIFINKTDIIKFAEYLRANDIPEPRWIGKASGSRFNPSSEYQYAQIQISMVDLTALKLMFDIHNSLF